MVVHSPYRNRFGKRDGRAVTDSTKHTEDKSFEPVIIFKQKWQCVTQCVLFRDSALAFKHSQHLNEKRALERQVGIFALLSSF